MTDTATRPQSDVQAMIEAATPLPWRLHEKEFDPEFAVSADGWEELATVYGHEDSDYLDEQGGVNAELIVYAVNHLPQYEAVAAALERVAWVQSDGLCWCDHSIGGTEVTQHRSRCSEARSALVALREEAAS